MSCVDASIPCLLLMSTVTLAVKVASLISSEHGSGELLDECQLAGCDPESLGA